jgi:GMP synthase (glutamine-hydrolysing)
MIKEIKPEELDIRDFINEKIGEIKNAVGNGTAINALSGGVDSSVVTMLGHKALCDRLRTVFIENGLMREGEPEQVRRLFETPGVKVEVIDARIASPTRLPLETMEQLAREIISEVPGIVSVTYNIAAMPSSTIEAV